MRAIFAAVVSVALLTGCSGDESTKPSPTAVATATPTVVPSPTPSATPTPTCESLSGDAGFPVMVGRIGDSPCVIWKGPQTVNVVIEEGVFATSNPPTKVVTVYANGSPFVLPPKTIPPFRGDDRCFDSDIGFTVRVEGLDGAPVGGESWHTCSRIVTLADGCSTGFAHGDGVGVGRRPSISGGQPEACIIWPDKVANETAFRIELSYPNSGEKFEYEVPANTVEFIPPEADTRGIGSFSAGLGRKDWSLFVFAITPTGVVPIGGQSVQVM